MLNFLYIITCDVDSSNVDLVYIKLLCQEASGQRCLQKYYTSKQLIIWKFLYLEQYPITENPHVCTWCMVKLIQLSFQGHGVNGMSGVHVRN